jgi:hypothetical protein
MAKKKKLIRPDEYHSKGPFEMARYGKNVIFHSNWREGDFEKMQQALVESYPEVVQEIDSTIHKIVNLVKCLPPEKLLQRAWTEAATRQMGISSESELDEDDSVSLRMVDYLQSVIVSVIPDKNSKEEIAEGDWQTLRSLVANLFKKLNFDYQLSHTALRRNGNPDFDVEYEQFYYAAQVHWCNVRGDRYLVHEEAYFRDLLSPHSDILMESYGISSEELISGISKIQHSLTNGLGAAFLEFRKYQEASLEMLEPILIQNDPKYTFEEAMVRVIEENGWKSKFNDLLGQMFGLDLFDLEKVTQLPLPLLGELSWEQGQDDEFFAAGEYAGWPLRIWPVFKRPFIKLHGRYYCFDLYSLLDNLYRVLQKLIIKHKNSYQSKWNEKQKEVSEELPFKYLRKILPSEETYRSVYYKWHTSAGGGKEWCEADGLLVYDDHLFVIEVKAGAFTYTSPANDFPAYIESIKSLILKPAVQGRRFIEYLNSENTVDIFDGNHCKIGELSKGDYRHITICPITIDSFTELAAQSKHLKKLGVELGELPVWSISVDDLRVYSDIFTEPLLFLHFVEQRINAYYSELIKTNDELDHLGLYLEHNNYVQYANELIPNPETLFNVFGYRSSIDKYFAEKLMEPEKVSPLIQEMPEILGEIIRCLQEKGKHGMSFIASYLLDHGGDLRNNIADMIMSVMQKQKALKKPLPLSSHGETRLTIFCWQDPYAMHDQKLVLEHSRAVMLAANENDRVVLELFYTNGNKLNDVLWQTIKVSDIPIADMDELSKLVENIKTARVEKAGKVGRNSPCPCGSGKKFKKCCIQ